MAQIKISQLTPKGAPLADTDLLAIAEQGIGTHVSKSVTGLNIVQRAQQGMQTELVSGTNIKTVNGGSILGSGNIDTTNPTQQYVPLNYGNGFADSVLEVQQPPAGYFGWSGLSTKIGSLISLPPGVDQSNVASILDGYGLSINKHPFMGESVILGDYQNQSSLTFRMMSSPITGSYAEISNSQGPYFYLDAIQQQYIFGHKPVFFPSPINGVQFEGAQARFTLNAGSSPYNPPFEYNASAGLFVMRDSFSPSFIGYNAGDAYVQSWGTIVMSSNLPIQFTNSNMFLNGGGTFNITGKALKIIDETGNTFFLPLYTI